MEGSIMVRCGRWLGGAFSGLWVGAVSCVQAAMGVEGNCPVRLVAPSFERSSRSANRHRDETVRDIFAKAVAIGCSVEAVRGVAS